MNFRDQLLAELSRQNTDYMASVVDSNEGLFKEFMDLVFSNEYQVSGRALWVIEICWLKYPWLIDAYINQMIDFLPKTNYDNQKRHLTKILSAIDLRKIDENRLGILIDCCFTWLEDPVYPPAVKVFSMQILYNYAEIEPVMVPELIAIIENQYEDSSPGFKNRGSKLLKKLYKINDQQ